MRLYTQHLIGFVRGLYLQLVGSPMLPLSLACPPFTIIVIISSSIIAPHGVPRYSPPFLTPPHRQPGQHAPLRLETCSGSCLDRLGTRRWGRRWCSGPEENAGCAPPSIRSGAADADQGHFTLPPRLFLLVLLLIVLIIIIILPPLSSACPAGNYIPRVQVSRIGVVGR